VNFVVLEKIGFWEDFFGDGDENRNVLRIIRTSL